MRVKLGETTDLCDQDQPKSLVSARVYCPMRTRGFGRFRTDFQARGKDGPKMANGANEGDRGGRAGFDEGLEIGVGLKLEIPNFQKSELFLRLA